MITRRTLITAGLSLLLVVTLCAGVLKWRGFRATSTPSALETVVARSIRDFAIPGRERRLVNPDANDWTAIQQGREDFLARCASCHGVDARGRTPIGTNVYPRVPDLHSDSTQNLSDGEIHYIIENGIQLTGMPAMPSAHRESAAESWKLVAYIRSLRSPDSRWRKLPQANTSDVSALHRLAGMPEMPCGHLRALEEDTDGERRARSARASGCDHSRSQHEQRLEVHEGAGGSCLRQHLEAALLHEGRRRLLSTARAMGHRTTRSGSSTTSRIQARTGGQPSIRRTTCSDRLARPATAVTPSTTTSTPSRSRNGMSAANAATARAANTSRIPRVATFSIPRRWMTSLRTTPASNAIHKDSLSPNRSRAKPTIGRSATTSVSVLQDYWKLENTTLGQTTFTHFRGWNRTQEPDAGQRLCAERDVRTRCHLLFLPRRPRHGELCATPKARGQALPRLSRPDLAKRPAHRDAGGTYSSQGRQPRQSVRSLPHAEDRNPGRTRHLREFAHLQVHLTGDDR